MTEIPIAPIDRIIRKAGAPRVSESAAAALAEILEKIALDIGAQAALLAKHAGRKTVIAEDVKLAEEQKKKM